MCRCVMIICNRSSQNWCHKIAKQEKKKHATNNNEGAQEWWNERACIIVANAASLELTKFCNLYKHFLVAWEVRSRQRLMRLAWPILEEASVRQNTFSKSYNKFRYKLNHVKNIFIFIFFNVKKYFPLCLTSWWGEKYFFHN